MHVIIAYRSHIDIHICICTDTYTHAHIHTCMHAYIHTCIHTDRYTCTYLYVYTYACISVYIYLHALTQIQDVHSRWSPPPVRKLPLGPLRCGNLRAGRCLYTKVGLAYVLGALRSVYIRTVLSTPKSQSNDMIPASKRMYVLLSYWNLRVRSFSDPQSVRYLLFMTQGPKVHDRCGMLLWRPSSLSIMP